MFAMKGRGYTLIELTVVLLLVALLLGGMLPKLSGKIEQQRMDDVRAQLNEIREALIGYAVANGRLPCPASSASSGAEGFAAGGSAADGNCSNFYDGLVPAATLGLATADGYAVDPWGNRIHYAVTSWSNNTYTRTNGMGTVGISNLVPNGTPYLQVCSTATGITVTNCASGMALTASPGVPALVYSTGRNGGYGGTGVDETANPNPNSNNNDRVFVSHTPAAAASGNGEFDDVMVWLSPNILYYRMVEAGKLP